MHITAQLAGGQAAPRGGRHRARLRRDASGAGVGLANIRERLAALYGEARAAHARGATRRAAWSRRSRCRPRARARARRGRAGPRRAPRQRRRRRRRRRGRDRAPAMPRAPARGRLAARVWDRRVERVLAQGALLRLPRRWCWWPRSSRSAGVVGVADGRVPGALWATRWSSGPVGALVGTAGAIIAFIAVAAALALVMLRDLRPRLLPRGARDLRGCAVLVGIVAGARAVRAARACDLVGRAAQPARRAGPGAPRAEPPPAGPA